ncbi:MAG TPA: hypothetical protein VK254_02415 [Candidatus Bathyarchaeia archaeon]|nr:hypothetical protein [Candidatus Bathyarchaeia archaeon]
MGIEDERKPDYLAKGEAKEKRNERVYVVTNLEDGFQEVMGETKMKALFLDEKDAKNKGFKVEHHSGGLSMDENGTIWGRPDNNYPNFMSKGDAVHDEVSGEDWCEMEFVPDKR